MALCCHYSAYINAFEYCECTLTSIPWELQMASDLAGGPPLCCVTLTRSLDPWQRWQNKIQRHYTFPAKHLWTFFQEEEELFLLSKPCSWNRLKPSEVQLEAGIGHRILHQNEHVMWEQAGTYWLNGKTQLSIGKTAHSAFSCFQEVAAWWVTVFENLDKRYKSRILSFSILYRRWIKITLV